MTVSEYIFGFLQKKGIDTVYMVSGSSAMWLTDALYRNTGLSAVCCQHEQAAAMAADGYGRTGNVPGVCLVTIGPGATNAVTGVAGAYLDSSPMFVISGQSNSRILQYQKKTGIRQKGTQSLVLESMVIGITKYFAEILDPAEIGYHMERAYHEAMTGRKGPVWIDVPIDIQNRQIPNEIKTYQISRELGRSAVPFSELREHLERADKPLILAGGGVIGAGAEQELHSFSERYQIPLVTSRGGIGAVLSEDPLFLGRPGSYGDRTSHFAIQECDFLLIVGCQLAVSTIGYYPGDFGKNAVKFMVDVDEKILQKEDVSVEYKLCMDAGDFLRELLRRAEEENWRCRDHDAWIAHCRDNKSKYPVVLPAYEKEEGINSYVFTKELSELAPENAGIVVDTGSVCNIVSQSWFLKRGQRYIISGGLSCMGFWTSAIGVVAHCPIVFALSGDGATQMNIQEFATLQYYHLPIKLFVYNNRGYMLIRHNQHNYMNDRFLGVGPDSGVPAVDFCRVARAYDVPCVRIDSKECIRQSIKEALEIPGPVLCEVMVQEFGVIAPRISSKVMPDGSLKAADFDDLWPFLGDES